VPDVLSEPFDPSGVGLAMPRHRLLAIGPIGRSYGEYRFEKNRIN